MLKRIVLIVLLSVGFYFNANAVAVICDPSGENCVEIIYVEIQGKLYDACCRWVSIPPGHSCEDDCNFVFNQMDPESIPSISINGLCDFFSDSFSNEIIEYMRVNGIESMVLRLGEDEFLKVS